MQGHAPLPGASHTQWLILLRKYKSPALLPQLGSTQRHHLQNSPQSCSRFPWRLHCSPYVFSLSALAFFFSIGVAAMGTPQKTLNTELCLRIYFLGRPTYNANLPRGWKDRALHQLGPPFSNSLVTHQGRDMCTRSADVTQMLLSTRGVK